MRERKRSAVLITNAPEDPERELRRREFRYVAMMLTRALCLIGAAILISTKPPLWGVWFTLCLLGMVFLPWFAVLLANDRPAKTRAERRQPPSPAPAPTQAALPSLPDQRVIDADL